MRDDPDLSLRDSVDLRHPASTSDAATPTVLIQPLHTSVPGRARLQVAGLCGSETLKDLLERGLTLPPAVRSATASSLTGNLVVHFDPAEPLRNIIDFATALVRGDLQPPGGDASGQTETASWHALDIVAVASALGSSPDTGLTEAEAADRLAQHGPNAMPRPAERTDFTILAGQFQSLPVALLAGAAVVSLLTGSPFGAAAILGVIGMNAAIGYQTESRAERTIQSLSIPKPQTTRVTREETARDVPALTLVLGDLIHLRRGTIVPADARLVSAQGLSVSEAMLTGESLPASKRPDVQGDANLLLADRTNMVYRGTLVTGGSGTALVVATGGGTEVGRIQRLVGTTVAPETPLQRQLDELGRNLVWWTMMAGGVLFGISWLRGLAFLQMTQSALSLSVAAVPEGLPMVATTTFALGVERMRKQGILARRLDAVESLASAQIICFDKTGTLTLNRMSVTTVALGDSLYDRVENGTVLGQNRLSIITPEDYRLRNLLTVACLCNETVIDEQNGRSVLVGSGTENALVQMALDSGLDPRALTDEFPRLSVQHRSEAYRFMATTHGNGGSVYVAVKGSPVEVLARCRWEATHDGGQRELTPERRNQIDSLNLEMARQALRVLGFAFRDCEPARAEDSPPPVQDLVWAGLVGMADPVRQGVQDLLSRLRGAGLQVMMLTGDQAPTALAVAERIGLNGHAGIKLLDAAELDRLSPSDLAEAARESQVFTRMSPAQKLRIVRSLQASGMRIAMVGDGLNDGPALRAADIGIALRQEGTAAAREVADIFLDTDALGSLALAIEESRTIHRNIRKSIHYLLSTNSSEILLMLVATAAGSNAALSPMQLLWINLISDVLPGIGLALEPASRDVMGKPPEPPDRPMVPREDFGRLAREASILAAGSLAAGGLGAARYGLNTPKARAITFGSLATAQLLHALTSRSADRSVLASGGLPPNPALSKILVGLSATQLAAMHLPGIRTILGLPRLGALDSLMALAGGLLPFATMEGLKLTRGSVDDDRLHFSRPRPNPSGQQCRPDVVQAG